MGVIWPTMLHATALHWPSCTIPFCNKVQQFNDKNTSVLKLWIFIHNCWFYLQLWILNNPKLLIHKKYNRISTIVDKIHNCLFYTQLLIFTFNSLIAILLGQKLQVLCVNLMTIFVCKFWWSIENSMALN